MQNIPSETGSYILWLQLNRKRRITVGRLGERLFQPGFYAYTGSAFGPGGLKARLGHHLKKAGRPHWHIDYLKNIAPAIEIWFTTSSENLEHSWSNLLAQWSDAAIPINSFGASDCSCSTHLHYFPEQPDFTNFNNILLNVEIYRYIP